MRQDVDARRQKSHFERGKEALIEKALGERVSQRAIARTLSCGRETVRRVLKKSPTPAA